MKRPGNNKRSPLPRSTLGAVNFADLMTLMTVFCCPMVAGITAASDHAGPFTIIFILAGLGAGFGGAAIVRIVAYAVLFAAIQGSCSRTWLAWPLMLAYIFLPVVALGGCLLGVGTFTHWLALAELNSRK